MLNQKETEILKRFMNDYSDRLSNDGCNDWDFPSNWATLEKENFVKRYHAWNGDPEEYRPNRLFLPNFAVAAFLAHNINKKNKDYSITISNANEIKKDWVLGYLTKEQQQDLIKTSENKDGPYIIKFINTSTGLIIKVFSSEETFLLNLTDYDCW